MAFEAIAGYLDKIEEGFRNKESPQAIAKRLGIPGKWQTIYRYKSAVWDMKDLVSDAKEIRAAKHDATRNEAVQEIVKTLDLINLGKLRAKQMLDIALGDEFETGEGVHKLTLGSASIYWPIGTRMMTDAVRLEMELSGDDPESRKASTLLELVNAVSDSEENGSV